MPLRREEVTEPDDVTRKCGAHEHRAARTGLDQCHAAQDQRAHDLLAECRFGDQQIMNLLAGDEQRLDCIDARCVHERGPAGKLTQLAGERAGAMVDHGHVVAMTVAAGDTNRAGEHEQDAGREFAGFEDSGPAANCWRVPKRTPVRFRRLTRREKPAANALRASVSVTVLRAAVRCVSRRSISVQSLTAPESPPFDHLRPLRDLRLR